MPPRAIGDNGGPPLDDLGDIRLLTIPDAADFLDCSRSKIYLMLEQGELGSVKLGRLRKIPVGELRRVVSTRSHWTRPDHNRRSSSE
jgi:excisionase family DNA binding protein